MAFKTIKIWTDTHKLIKRICAETGESLVAMLHRIVQTEWKKVSLTVAKSAIKEGNDE